MVINRPKLRTMETESDGTKHTKIGVHVDLGSDSRAPGCGIKDRPHVGGVQAFFLEISDFH